MKEAARAKKDRQENVNVKEPIVSKDIDVLENPRVPEECGGESHRSRQSQLQFSN